MEDINIEDFSNDEPIIPDSVSVDTTTYGYVKMTLDILKINRKTGGIPYSELGMNLVNNETVEFYNKKTPPGETYIFRGKWKLLGIYGKQSELDKPDIPESELSDDIVPYFNDDDFYFKWMLTPEDLEVVSKIPGVIPNNAGGFLFKEMTTLTVMLSNVYLPLKLEYVHYVNNSIFGIYDIEFK